MWTPSSWLAGNRFREVSSMPIQAARRQRVERDGVPVVDGTVYARDCRCLQHGWMADRACVVFIPSSGHRCGQCDPHLNQWAAAGRSRRSVFGQRRLSKGESVGGCCAVSGFLIARILARSSRFAGSSARQWRTGSSVWRLNDHRSCSSLERSLPSVLSQFDLVSCAEALAHASTFVRDPLVFSVRNFDRNARGRLRRF